MSCGCALASVPLIQRQAPGRISAPRTWDDGRFAQLMADGMRDYEQSISPLKAALLSSLVPAGGALLEVGVGTGPSLRHYAAAARVVGVEPNLAMHPHIRAAAEAAGLGDRFTVVANNAEQLPFPDASFDAVVGTMLLCSVRDVPLALAEVRRVLKPGGSFAFIEHVSAPDDSLLRAMQVALDPLQKALFCGCHLARDPLPALASCGFARVDAARFSLNDAQAMAAVEGLSGWRALAALRAAATDDGAGWRAGGRLQPHFLLSPHVAGICTA